MKQKNKKIKKVALFLFSNKSIYPFLTSTKKLSNIFYGFPGDENKVDTEKSGTEEEGMINKCYIFSIWSVLWVIA